MRLLLVFILALSLPTSVWSQDSQEGKYDFRKNLAEGATLLAQGQTARALARFNHAQNIATQKLGGESAEAYYWIGLVYYDMQNYGLAAKNAEKARLLDEKMASTWLLWGQCLLQMQKLGEARDKLEQALILESDNYLTYFNLGLCYYYGLDDKNKATALKYFKKCLDLKENYTPARLYRGCCYLEADINWLATIEFKQVVKAEPQNAEAYYRLGLACRKQNRTEEAEKAFLEVLRIDRSHAEANLQLGHLYQFELKDKEKALLYYKRFLAANTPDHPWRQKVEAFMEKQNSKKPEEPSGQRQPASNDRLVAPI